MSSQTTSSKLPKVQFANQQTEGILNCLLPVNLWATKDRKISEQDICFKTNRSVGRYESLHISVMTAATSRKKRLHVIMISRCQGDDIFVAFQPMGLFRFWRNTEFTFFQRCLQPTYLSRSLTPPLPHTSTTTTPPSQFFLLCWRPVLSRSYQRIQRSKQNMRK